MILDQLITLIMFVSSMLIWTIIMWSAIMSVMWYLALIPCLIGTGFGLYFKNWRYPLVGLAIGWFGSWVVALVSTFFVKF